MMPFACAKSKAWFYKNKGAQMTICPETDKKQRRRRMRKKGREKFSLLLSVPEGRQHKREQERGREKGERERASLSMKKRRELYLEELVDVEADVIVAEGRVEDLEVGVINIFEDERGRLRPPTVSITVVDSDI